MRRVGLFGATVSGVGVIVGAGIYALIGEVAGIAGGAAWAAFLLAAVVAGLTGASYARMGRAALFLAEQLLLFPRCAPES